MAKAKEGKKASGGFFRRLNSLRNQVGAIVVLSYLIPALLLGTFTGTILLRGLDRADTGAAAGKVGVHDGNAGHGTVADALALEADAGGGG